MQSNRTDYFRRSLAISNVEQSQRLFPHNAGFAGRTIDAIDLQ